MTKPLGAMDAPAAMERVANSFHGGFIMRRFLATTLLAILICTSVGCFVPIYDADPAVRARQLINTSEDLRALRSQWHRFWFLDQPDHMKPVRTHGGII